MTPEDILTRVGNQLGIRRVFGERTNAIESSLSRSPLDRWRRRRQRARRPGQRRGFGGTVRGVGGYSISNGQVRFVPAVDTTALAAMLVLALGVVIHSRRRRGA